ncbi:GNAT family N-acetyltransferase [Cryobacterium adonitolivorans]|uniref:GNAT family N-acetyltransferase n=1 Tax=Cryobacterium adonitolivorans TaxID=1259189 RepID=A0A4V3IC47_9MICO|nr:GNAT family N-acetyltransferase [Cryobacterium adonitolivorans]TFB98731.1 GNAT family N-acetyltransferase [Cryobacterium adonitolivorans]
MAETRTPAAPREVELYCPTADDWAGLRDIRLRSIANFPLGFFESFAAALALTEADWRQRGARNTEPTSFQVVARPPGEQWVGTMASFVSSGPPSYRPGETPVNGPVRANLVGVWVDPSYRGPTGVATQLLVAVRTWVAEEHHLDRLYLHVHESNHRAIRFYEKNGGRPTGDYITDPHRTSERHLEMVLATEA